MTALWLVLFIGGLLLSVRVMLAGVIKTSGALAAGPGDEGLHTVLPMVGSFCTVAGIVGYLLARAKPESGHWPFSVALSAAFLAAVCTRVLVLRSSSSKGYDPEDDLRFRFQGHVARVVESIAPGRPGRVLFQGSSGQCNLRALALDGRSVAVGVEVVIERIENDVAIVEPWSTVEERL